jgi:hypothetical protein
LLTGTPENLFCECWWPTHLVAIPLDVNTYEKDVEAASWVPTVERMDSRQIGLSSIKTNYLIMRMLDCGGSPNLIYEPPPARSTGASLTRKSSLCTRPESTILDSEIDEGISQAFSG